ncbi:RNA polymerase sigma factor [Microbacterium marinilacus]|uniref:RNA polymerase sigma factor n=1 Tax=Microbacterium marinilacus TaxID=415209 RepID=A0ABP7BA32_9MICO|nr:RNA polymerase sigma factor [Microbacterium marinilacus]MBY0687026.1 RNA polymerase sigma factor [Microbacterium marinilacus]
MRGAQRVVAGDGPSSRAERALEGAPDRLVAARAADGDRQAFAVLIRRYTPAARAYARWIVPRPDDVDTTVRAAFVSAWRGMPGLDDPAAFEAWLLRIVGLEATAGWRVEPAGAEVGEPAAAPTPPAPPRGDAPAPAGVADMRAALSRLFPAQRACWALHELGGCGEEEIAEQLGMPAATVRRHLADARASLVRRLHG